MHRGMMLAAALGVMSALTARAVPLEGRVVMGSSGTLFGAQASSWVRLDTRGAVQEVGVTLPMAGVAAAPLPSASDAPPTEANMMAMIMANGPTLRLEFPAVVKDTTFLDHLDLYWEAFGHPPERYLTPHFDLHFFGVTSAAVDRIDCKNLTPPDLALTPAGFAPAVPPGADPAAICVPLMGFHGFALSEFSGPGKFRPGLFDHTLISGFYNNAYLFTEPMVTRAFMMSRQEFSSALSRPQTVGRSTRYPTQMTMTHDERANAYQLVYSGFEQGL